MLRKGALLSLLRTSSGLGIRLCRILPRIGANGGTPCRGVRVLFFAFAGLYVCLPAVLAFSCFLIGLLSVHLCGRSRVAKSRYDSEDWQCNGAPTRRTNHECRAEA